MKKRVRKNLLAAALVLLGLLLVGYPLISNYFYEKAVDSTVTVYEEAAKEQDDSERERLFAEARKYNTALAAARVQLTDPFIAEETEVEEAYDSLFRLDDTGIMGFVEIPKIDIYLPIYHGTTEEVLAKGIGHLKGSAFPIGGENTHCVISGHTGLDRAKLFTDLNLMEEGDLFFLHVLGQVQAYRVCAIHVVLPEETDHLAIDKGRDLCTLLTCTPYGVNSHRLLVTGEACDYDRETVAAERPKEAQTPSTWQQAYQKALITASCGAICFLLLLRICGSLLGKRRGGKDHG